MFRPEARSLYRTFDMNAFAEDSALDDNKNAQQQTDEPASPIDLGAYMASSSYIVSLGGPPLPDLKYGIIIVPEIHVKSKKAQKEQMEEFRQKAADELANESEWKPELDEQERDFYRQRWWDRAGHKGYYSSRLSDYMANRERRRQFEAGELVQPAEENETEFRSSRNEGYWPRKWRLARENSRASGRDDYDDGPIEDALVEPDQSNNYDADRSPSFLANKSVEDRQKHRTEYYSPQERKALEEERMSVRSNSRASNRDASHHDPLESPTDVEIDRVQNEVSHGLSDSAADKAVEAPPLSVVEECDPQEQKASAHANPSLRSKGSRESNRDACSSVPIETDPHVKTNETDNCNGDDDNTNNQTRPSASMVASSQNTIIKESMSHEACQTLEPKSPRESNRDACGSVTIETDTHAKPDETHDCNCDDNNTNYQTQPSPPTIASSQNTIIKESMSHACQTLEPLLGKKKRKGVRGVFKSMLSSSRSRASPDPVVTRRDVLLEIGKAMTSLANGELHDNPGIDRRIWEKTRNDLAVRTW
ncbi:hypothetical protein VE02_03832, partial [Pseudogymnoascus sp. 03VT05]